MRRGVFNRLIFLSFLFVFSSIQVPYAQEPKRNEIDLDAFIQQLFKTQDQDLPYEDMYETLFQYYRTPLDLNQASAQDLRNLFILNEAQINAFIQHRKTTGDLLSLYELQAIEFMDQMTIQRLLPFVIIHNKEKARDNRTLWQRIKTEHENHFLLLRFRTVAERQKGYFSDGSGKYLGGPGAWYLRYRLQHAQDFSFGITMEKDAGEPWAWNIGNQTFGADFLSFHASVMNKGRWKNITLGDFTMQVGQGLVMAGGFFLGKGSETIATIRRSTMGIRPYTSVFEAGFFRGAAAAYQWKGLEIGMLLSHKPADARVISTGNDTLSQNDDFASGLLATGYHRTATEISVKNTIRETHVGGYAQWENKAKTFQLGLSALQTWYNIPILKAPTVYNTFDFRGNSNLVAGANVSYVWQNFNFFGEVARSQSGGWGGVGGVVATLSHHWDVALLYRSFDKNFQSLFANAFNEGTRVTNEEGFYWGIKYKPSKKLETNVYLDLFRFPWLRFRVDGPSQGAEWLCRINYKPTKTVGLSLQYREERKERNSNNENAKIDILIPTIKRNVMIQAEYKYERKLTFRTRAQGSSFDSDGYMTYGFALAQDIQYDFGDLAICARYCVFDTDDYDNRQYMYEKNVLYTFSIPAYYGKGYRTYIIAQYTLWRKIDLWVRWGNTTMLNQKTLGSGGETTDVPYKNDWTVQVRYKL